MTFYRNETIHVLDNLAAERQPYSGTRVGVFAVKPLEHTKDLFGIFFLKADAIIRDGYL